MTYLKNKRDTAETAIVQALKQVGALWIPMHREAGFDGLVLFRGCTHIAENKNSEKDKLTANEEKCKAECESRGVKYNVIWSVDMAMEMIELTVIRGSEANSVCNTEIDNAAHYCGMCWKPLTAIRPGKWQCDNPKCGSNHA